jgi:hypothetical protein
MSMSQLCIQILSSKEASGDGWESLFVLFLLARCLTNEWADILPKPTFLKTSKKTKIYFDEPFDNRGKSYDDVQSWSELVERITPGEDPAISIFYPTHASFVGYDAVVVYTEDKAIKEITGYQMKEGKNHANQDVESSFRQSYVVKGAPPGKQTPRFGWTIPSDTMVENFFGVSGKYWTPKKWNALRGTERSSMPEK